MNFLNNKEELALRLAEILNYGNAKGVIELVFMIVCLVFLLIVIVGGTIFAIIQYKKNKQEELEEQEEEDDDEEDQERYVNYTYNEAFRVLNNQIRAFRRFHKQTVDNTRNESVEERFSKLGDYIKSVDLSHGILDELLTECIYTDEFFKKTKYYNKFYRLFFKRNQEFEKLQNLLEELLLDTSDDKNKNKILLEEK